MKFTSKLAMAGAVMAVSASAFAGSIPTTLNVGVNDGLTHNFIGHINGGSDDIQINLTGSGTLSGNVTFAPARGNPTITLLDSLSQVISDVTYSMTAVGPNFLGAPTYMTLQFAKWLDAGTYYIHLAGSNLDNYAGNVNAVPLPGAALLFGSALFGAGALRRKKAQALAVA